MSGQHKGNFFNDFATSLVGHGFTVIPTNGKQPVTRRWTNPTPTDLSWLTRMLASNRYRDCNTGIVCGRVVAIDIDADEPAKVEQLRALADQYLGPTPFQRNGRAPRTLLLYRPLDDIASTTIAGIIDVLSGGRQFIAYGIHPDTGQCYQWCDSHHNPVTANLEELPPISAADLRAFADAVCTALGIPLKGIPAVGLPTPRAALRARQKARQVEMLGSQYNDRIVCDANGRVTDGREPFLAKLTAAEYAKGAYRSPDELARGVWARFAHDTDLSRAKGSNPRRRWSFGDAQTKARSICRRKPELKYPRRARGGHQASHLNGWRQPGYWKAEQREVHLAEVCRRIQTPATLAVARIMIEAVELATGFCTMSIAEIAKRASCSPTTVKTARRDLNNAGLWLSTRGVSVPCSALNSNHRNEKTRQKPAAGNIKVAPLYHLSLVPSLPSLRPEPKSAPLGINITTSRPYQPDMFGAPVVDLATERKFRRGLIPADVAALVRAEMRARGVTQDELAILVGISQPQLANALAGRFGLSPDPAARLLTWLRKVA
jgi:AcrR family transcriptional regulator